MPLFFRPELRTTGGGGFKEESGFEKKRKLKPRKGEGCNQSHGKGEGWGLADTRQRRKGKGEGVTIIILEFRNLPGEGSAKCPHIASREGVSSSPAKKS